MAKNSSFTDEERAAWHKARREQREEYLERPTCIHCGNPLGRDVPAGYEGALCSACE